MKDKSTPKVNIAKRERDGASWRQRWGELAADGASWRQKWGELAANSNGSSLLWYEMEYSGSDI